MGMFDTIKVDVNKLPGLSDKEREKLKDAWWQTKDFDCMLDTIYINDNGVLEISRAFDDSPQATDIRHIDGSFDFYTMIDDDWYQFEAVYKDGSLVKIERKPENIW